MKRRDKKVVICDLWSPKNGEVKLEKGELLPPEAVTEHRH